jgi:hypothetical protein
MESSSSIQIKTPQIRHYPLIIPAAFLFTGAVELILGGIGFAGAVTAFNLEISSILVSTGFASLVIGGVFWYLNKKHIAVEDPHLMDDVEASADISRSSSVVDLDTLTPIEAWKRLEFIDRGRTFTGITPPVYFTCNEINCKNIREAVRDRVQPNGVYLGVSTIIFNAPLILASQAQVALLVDYSSTMVQFNRIVIKMIKKYEKMEDAHKYLKENVLNNQEAFTTNAAFYQVRQLAEPREKESALSEEVERLKANTDSIFGNASLYKAFRNMVLEDRVKVVCGSLTDPEFIEGIAQSIKGLKLQFSLLYVSNIYSYGLTSDDDKRKFEQCLDLLTTDDKTLIVESSMGGGVLGDIVLFVLVQNLYFAKDPQSGKKYRPQDASRARSRVHFDNHVYPKALQCGLNFTLTDDMLEE